MISLIIGNKGSGKTKHLIDEVNKALAASNGHVVCVEKMMKLTYEIKPQVRLINADEFLVSGYDMYYGFLAGLCSRDADITDILCDGTLRIGGRDPEDSRTSLRRSTNCRRSPVSNSPSPSPKTSPKYRNACSSSVRRSDPETPRRRKAKSAFLRRFFG